MTGRNNQPDSDLALQRLRIRRLTLDAVLLAMALVLSIVEHWIPLNLIVPVPGIKLGLANIITLFALMRLRPLDAILILVIRCLVMGAIAGPMTLIFSLTGGSLALLIMWLLGRLEGRVFSVIGLSLAGAAAHNVGQVAVAGFILDEPLLLLTYLPPLLLTSLITGTLTGVAAFPVVRRFKPLPDLQRKMRRSGRPTIQQMLIMLLICGMLGSGILPLAGCASAVDEKYSYEFTGTFDTVIQFIGYARQESDFQKLASAGETRFRELNQLFDPYHIYDGLNNVKTINDQAGITPVKVPADLLNLISQCIEWNRTISDKTNIAVGPVILLWQKYRDAGLADPASAVIPSKAELQQALAHSDINDIQIDRDAGTVYLADPEMQLDLGAVGKGYATELVTQLLIGMGADSMIINAGGSNVRTIGKPKNDRDFWNVGLQNPQALLPDSPGTGNSANVTPEAVKETIGVLHLNDSSVVTSGDYQRYYQVGDTVYHHIIDPVDGMPAHYFRAVSVITKDSGLADFLSTALFLLPYEQSRALAESLDDVQVIWIFTGNQVKMTPGVEKIVEMN